MTDRREIEQFNVWRSARTFGIDFYRSPWETTSPPAGVVMDIETARMLREALDWQIYNANLEDLPDRPWSKHGVLRNEPSPPDHENSGPAEDLVSTEVHGHS